MPRDPTCQTLHIVSIVINSLLMGEIGICSRYGTMVSSVEYERRVMSLVEYNYAPK